MADTEQAVTTEETAPVDTEMPDAAATTEATETAAKDESTKDESTKDDATPADSGDVKEEAAPEYVPDEPAETFQFNADIAQLMR